MLQCKRSVAIENVFEFFHRHQDLSGLCPLLRSDDAFRAKLIHNTGGTVEAIAKLVERLGGKVVKLCFLIELAGLCGRKKLKDYDIGSAIIYEGK